MKPEVDIDRLCRGAYRSCLSLARVRENVNFMVRQYAGDTYAEEGAELRTPLNLISLYHRIVLPKLVADNPRFSLTSWNDQARHTVETMQDVGNDVVKRIRLGNTLERAASSALFASGWVKVGVAKSDDVARYAYKLDKGNVYASNISIDDMCWDSHARHIDEVAFIGHRYRVPLELIRDDPRYNKKRRESLTATEDKLYGELGTEKTSVILRGYFGQGYDLWDMVELWEFYVPRTNSVIVVTADDVMGQSSAEPLLDEEWIGNRNGTGIGGYHLCGFGPVPDNLLPKAPIPDIVTLHEDTNNLLRKLIMQAKDQKTVLPIRPGSETGAKNLLNTNNGEAFECANPEGLRELNFGGPDAKNFQLMQFLKELTDWSSGNMSAVGGLAPQAKTASQEKMLTATSSATIADMQRRMVDFAAGVGEDILWYLWHDPYTTHDMPFEMEGVGSIPRRVTPEERRQEPFEKLKLILEPYSMQRQTPAEVDAQLTQIVTQEIGPILQLLQGQGTVLDAREYMAIKAKLLNRPELLRILSLQPPPVDAGGGGDAPGMPANTQRSYVRENRSERTLQGDHQEHAAAMMQAEGGQE